MKNGATIQFKGSTDSIPGDSLHMVHLEDQENAQGPVDNQVGKGNSLGRDEEKNPCTDSD